jgi:orotidine-5'-phosphate decarboxylase
MNSQCADTGGTDMHHSPLIVALDTPSRARARDLRQKVAGAVGAFKIGKEFFTAEGPDGVRDVVGDAPLFLDLKFHDIPNTVAGAVRSAMKLDPLILNVHASGGPAMMRAAAAAAAEGAQAAGRGRPLVIAVTVLTSLDENDLAAVGQRAPLEDQVTRLALLTAECGLDGVVCSPREIERLRRECGPDFKLVVPGVRPSWASGDDQKRTMSPAEAMAKGADYLVIGRPVSEAPDPTAAAYRILEELERS